MIKSNELGKQLFKGRCELLESTIRLVLETYELLDKCLNISIFLNNLIFDCFEARADIIDLAIDRRLKCFAGFAPFLEFLVAVVKIGKILGVWLFEIRVKRDIFESLDRFSIFFNSRLRVRANLLKTLLETSSLGLGTADELTYNCWQERQK